MIHDPGGVADRINAIRKPGPLLAAETALAEARCGFQ